MHRLLSLIVCCLLLSACAIKPAANEKKFPQGKIESVVNFQSTWVQSRNVDIWLPRQYLENPRLRLPVLYMHDGQNLFDTKKANFGTAWELNRIAQSLIDAGKIRPSIIVGVWSSPKRRLEYFPQKAHIYFTESDKAVEAQMQKHFGEYITSGYLGDNYLKFLVTEVKPYIDVHYRTLSDVKHTFIAGSSMGGLASLYAVAEYPQIFGGAACLSTHWPLVFNNDHPELSQIIRSYMSEQLPKAGNHKFYFDFGTETLDALYENHQLKVDDIMRAKGYVQNRDWVTRKFIGAAHNEQSWQARSDVFLTFILGVDKKTK